MGMVRTGPTLRTLARRRPAALADCLEFPAKRSVAPQPRSAALDRADWVCAAVVALAVAVACLLIARSLPSVLFQSMDFWFEADTLREISNMTRVHDDHYRTSVHPLFSLMTFMPV